MLDVSFSFHLTHLNPLQSVHEFMTTELSLLPTHSCWMKKKCSLVVGLAFLGNPVFICLNRWSTLLGELIAQDLSCTCMVLLEADCDGVRLCVGWNH